MCSVAEISPATARCIGKARWKENETWPKKWTCCSKESWGCSRCPRDSWSMGCPRRRRMTVHDHLMLMRRLRQVERRDRCHHQATHVSNKVSASEKFPFSNRKKGCQLIFFGQMIKMKYFPRNKQRSFCSLYFWKGSFWSHAVVTLIEEQSARVITIADPNLSDLRFDLKTLIRTAD